METSLNDKGDLERGLLDDKESKDNTTSDVLCHEADKGAIIAVMIAVVLLASLGFLIYLGVVVLEMKSDVNKANALATPIDKLTQKVGNLYTYVQGLDDDLQLLTQNVHNLYTWVQRLDDDLQLICQNNRLNCS